MKRLTLLVLLSTVPLHAATIETSTATTITVNLSGNEFFAVVPLTCETTIQTTVPCPACPAVSVSTGPFTMKAATGDCYRAEFINPNGTLATKWVPCP